MRWSNGGPLGIAAQLEATEARIRDGAHDVVREVVQDAERNQSTLLEHAETATGRRRAAAGRGVAGRVESGQMINAINSSAVQDDSGDVVGRWGWQDPEDYYGYQDEGTQHIAPALSLLTSFLVAKTDLSRKLRAMVSAGGKR